jgi:hypothetical protein
LPRSDPSSLERSLKCPAIALRYTLTDPSGPIGPSAASTQCLKLHLTRHIEQVGADFALLINKFSIQLEELDAQAQRIIGFVPHSQHIDEADDPMLEAVEQARSKVDFAVLSLVLAASIPAVWMPSLLETNLSLSEEGATKPWLAGQ